MTPSNRTLSDVRNYYDRNTRAFIARGQGGELGAIHRSVWGPGTQTEAEAFTFLERDIADRLVHLQTPNAHVVDLGCGVGASMCFLAELTSAHFTGVTLSPEQAELARDRIEGLALGERVACVQGDYCKLPSEVRTADLAYAIESFLHTPDAGAFFVSASKLVRPGGLLVVCDDFLSQTYSGVNRWVERFREGWHAPNLDTDAHCIAHAESSGFELIDNSDLTEYLELGRPRDWAIAALMHAFGWLPIRHPQFQMLRGGHALQRCLLRGKLNFRRLVFRRTNTP